MQDLGKQQGDAQRKDEDAQRSVRGLRRLRGRVIIILYFLIFGVAIGHGGSRL